MTKSHEIATSIVAKLAAHAKVTVSLHLPEIHFPKKHLPEKNISLSVLFAELSFVRNHTRQNKHLPKITSARMNTCLNVQYICQNEHLPEIALARLYFWPNGHFSENVFSRIDTCQNSSR